MLPVFVFVFTVVFVMVVVERSGFLSSNDMLCIMWRSDGSVSMSVKVVVAVAVVILLVLLVTFVVSSFKGCDDDDKMFNVMSCCASLIFLNMNFKQKIIINAS